jgi:carboxyl-terminal processing protease
MSLFKRLTIATVATIALTLSLGAQTLPLERRIFILSKTYQSIPLHFAHWRTASYRPEELDSIYQVFLKRAVETENRKDFAFVMREFVALLNNGHSWYNDTKTFGAALPLGFSWMNLDRKWTITRSIIEGLQPGDIVVKINGMTVDEHYSKLSRYFAASDVRAKQVRLIWTLASLLPAECTLEIQTKTGTTKQLIVNRAALKTTPTVQKTESRWLETDKIAYIKVPSFNSPEFERDAVAQVKAYIHAPAIIVDVRGNGGGSTPSRLVQALMNRPYRWWTEGTPLTVGLFRYYAEARPNIELNEYFRNAQLTWQSEETRPDSGAFAGKLFILADRNTGSAAEDFTVPFKDNGRATIIGETTNGSTGQPYMYNFGDGISIGIGTKRAYMPNGAEFEGIGIVPDIAVPVQREDLYAGKDRALERAIAEAKQEIQLK